MASRLDTTIETGRTYDIDFVNWTESVEGEAQFVFGDLSKKTTGVIKAVNKFLNTLLTRKGSDPFDLNRGTLFEEVQYRGGDTVETIGTFASNEVSDALSQTQSIQSEYNWPDDENIVDVVISDIELTTSDKLILKLRITTEAGVGVSVKVPMLGG